MKFAAGPQISLSFRYLLGQLAASSFLGASKALSGTAPLQDALSTTATAAAHINTTLQTLNATDKLQYVIYPTDRYDVEQTNATERFLQKSLASTKRTLSSTLFVVLNSGA